MIYIHTPIMSHFRTPLTKDILHNYKYLHQIMRYAVNIFDTICDDIEKRNIDCEKNTKYAYKIDEQSPLYKSIATFNTKMAVLTDILKQLRYMFPDSKINVVEKETMNGFVVTTSTYIEVDWS
jgi:hypothetical protein